MSEPTNLSQKLSELRAALGGVDPASTLALVQAQIAALLGSNPADPVTLADLLYRLRGDDGRNLTSLYNEAAYTRQAVDLLLSKVDALRGPNNATLSGLLSEDQFDTQSALMNGILLDIKACVCAAAGYLRELSRGVVYDDVTGAGFTSSGIKAVDGRICALWPSLPASILPSDGGRVLSTANWAFFELLAQTTDPAPLWGGEAITPGVWTPLAGSGERALCAAAGHPVTGYLRQVSSYYYEFETQQYTEGPNTRQGIVADGIPGFTLHDNDGSGWATASLAVFWQCAAPYWIRLKPGYSAHMVIAFKDGPNAQWNDLTLSNAWQQVNGHYRNIAWGTTPAQRVQITLEDPGA